MKRKEYILGKHLLEKDCREEIDSQDDDILLKEISRERQEQDEQDKEGGVGVREPRKPIKPSDKDSISLSLSST